jgi:CPA2 family monovalent cation:H+ antiporter-2
MSVKRTAGGDETPALRSIVANTILGAGSVLLILILLLLSSTILPSWKLLVAQALIVVASAILLRRSFIKLYSKAEYALEETLSQPSAPHRELSPQTMPAILRDAQLTTVPISEQMPCAGKLIGELALRTRTGASIVGIQRDGANIVNPGPDEELRPGDEVLLLGNQENLESARKLLISGPATP